MGLIPVSSAEEKLAELRMQRCQRCIHSFESKVLRVVNGHGEYIRKLACRKCSCPVWEKTIVVDEKCPEGKW